MRCKEKPGIGIFGTIFCPLRFFLSFFFFGIRPTDRPLELGEEHWGNANGGGDDGVDESVEGGKAAELGHAGLVIRQDYIKAPGGGGQSLGL